MVSISSTGTILTPEKAADYCKETISLKNSLEAGFIDLGKRLKNIRDNELYGTQYQTFPLFCEELKMSESKASKIILVYERLVLKYGIDPNTIAEAGGYSDVYAISNRAQTKEEAEEWLARGALLTSSDLRKEIALAKVGGACEHDMHELHINQCKLCGYKEKVFTDKG